MRAGRLDRLITIQRRTSSPDDAGEPTDSWSTITPARRPASMMPVRGDERFSADQYSAKGQVEFRIRWSLAVADLSPLDRVLYPAPASGSEAGAATLAIYNIIETQEIGRREGLAIIAYRQADVTT